MGEQYFQPRLLLAFFGELEHLLDHDPVTAISQLRDHRQFHGRRRFMLQLANQPAELVADGRVQLWLVMQPPR